MERDFSLYEAFFDSSESRQYKDLQKKFDADFVKNVVESHHDFSCETWFRLTVASALNEYFTKYDGVVATGDVGNLNDKK